MKILSQRGGARRRILGVLGIGVLAGGIILTLDLTTESARADIHSNDCWQYPSDKMMPCRMDDRNADYCTAVPWPAHIGGRFGEAMSNLDGQTILYDTYANPCGSQTDLGGHLSGQTGEVVLPYGTLGKYLCTKLYYGGNSSEWRCDQASIIFAPYDPAFDKGANGWTDAQQQTAWRNVLCHEIGHGVGLYHDTGIGGCMDSVFPVPSTPRYYQPHHVDHINAAH
ncbi:hypothetical protein G3H63_04675 [Microbacterium resistens]|uniref:hypothetical protein n=1 Tax=Microbacterium resistens TaxID=156977 RepID=UPI001C56FD32|nr:hypothetical protein [Microbacterium resistens]MBW1638375.1 hypothetical protein [Microbacterium resistens]